MTEGELQEEVRKLAKRYEWLYYHTHDSRRSPAGFPDCVLLSPGRKRLVFAELKDETREPTEEQRVWLRGLGEVERMDVFLWRPDAFRDGVIDSVLA